MVPSQSWVEKDAEEVPSLSVHGKYKLFPVDGSLIPPTLITISLLPVSCRRERSGKMALARCVNARVLRSLAMSPLAHRVQCPPWPWWRGDSAVHIALQVGLCPMRWFYWQKIQRGFLMPLLFFVSQL